MNLEKKTSIKTYLKNSSLLKGALVTFIGICAIILVITFISFFYDEIFAFFKNLNGKSIGLVFFFIIELLFIIGVFAAYGDDLKTKILEPIGIILGTNLLVAIVFSILGGLGYITYFVYPHIYDIGKAYVKNPSTYSIDIGSFIACGTFEVIFLVGLGIFFVKYLHPLGIWSFNKIIAIIPSIKLYKKAEYIPITKEELIKNGINSPKELESFFVNDLFKDIKKCEELDVFAITNEIKESYKNSIELGEYGLEEKYIEDISSSLCWDLTWHLKNHKFHLCHFEVFLEDALNEMEKDKKCEIHLEEEEK